jgi:hypothetical protein
VDDPCAFELRSQNLSEQPWPACSAAAEPPRGCEAVELPPRQAMPVDLPLTVAIHEADARKFEAPPDMLVYASSARQDSGSGIFISHSPESIAYGVHRVHRSIHGDGTAGGRAGGGRTCGAAGPASGDAGLLEFCRQYEMCVASC